MAEHGTATAVDDARDSAQWSMLDTGETDQLRTLLAKALWSDGTVGSAVRGVQA